MEKVIVVGVRLEDIDINEFNDEIDELKNLVFACDMEVVDTISQNLPYINKATYVGSGKVEEIKTAINALDAEGVVFNDELTPSQISNLEDIQLILSNDEVSLTGATCSSYSFDNNDPQNFIGNVNTDT